VGIVSKGWVKPLFARGSRARIFTVALIVSSICGAIEFGEPLEDVLKGARDVARSQSASGDIVVVARDDKTIRELGSFEISRTIDARLVDRLFEQGASRVFFDQAFSSLTTPEADAAFAAALARHRGRAFLGALRPIDPRTRKPTEIFPIPALRAASEAVDLTGKTTPFQLSAKLFYADTWGGRKVDSLSKRLSRTDYADTTVYRPDWSIRASSVPTVSMVDVIERRADAGILRGKDVVVGLTSLQFNDHHNLVFQGFQPGVYFHVIGAESLKRGMPVNYGWLPAFVAAVLLSVLVLWCRRRIALLAVPVSGLVLFGLLPLVFDAALITIDIVPALVLFLTCAYRAHTLRRVEAGSMVDPVSGLPNLTALRAGPRKSAQTLIAAKVRNYAEIAASFDEAVERDLIAELCRRIGIARDTPTIYHGDDTLIWFSDQPMAHELAAHLEGLHGLSTRAMKIGAREVDLVLSFGVDADHDRPVISRIGSAMLCADEAARANDIWKFYDPERRHEAAWQLSLMSRLDHAIDTGEIWIAYQPKMDFKTRRIVGAEALVRWQHPERGLIGPDEFISAAEAHNRIDKLTAFVLERSIAAAANLNRSYGSFGIAVNLSAQMLQLPNLLDTVSCLLDRHGLPTDRLTLEVTETGQLASHPQKIAMMQALSERGIQMSIDDYGTGNATLEYLKVIPFDEVKIDRKFVAALDQSEADFILVRSTIDMAHSLGRRVVAEGIESEIVFDVLAELGCDVAQGFLIGRPVDLATLSTRLLSGRQTARG
jgi:diguanylate cyclase